MSGLAVETVKAGEKRHNRVFSDRRALDAILVGTYLLIGQP
jgi:hypothetical protein